METKPPNPNVFPVDAGSSIQRGMSLRDYFANSAMQGLTTKYGETYNLNFDERAKESYKIADAMLKAREL